VNARTLLLGLCSAIALAAACSATSAPSSFGDDTGTGDGSGGNGAGAGGAHGTGGGLFAPDAGDACAGATCSIDKTQVVGCDGSIVKVCGATEQCQKGACVDACTAAKANKSSVGCEYYAVSTDGDQGADDGCFVAFIANTSPNPAHLSVTFHGQAIDLAKFAKIPQGSGQSLTYGPYSVAAGLAPSEVAIVFLSNGAGGGVTCPVPAAVAGAQVKGTARGAGFRITTDVPVVAYEMLPYGGGSAAVTGATLLLPTSAWDTNYIAVDAYQPSQAAGTPPGLALVAAEDFTNVTILPKVAIEGGVGVPAAPAGQPVKFTLGAGEVLQLSQNAELVGSPIQSDKPIGMWAVHRCMNVPPTAPYCDHGEQQIPPVRALGSRYAAASYRQRSSVPETPIYRLIGAVDGTTLTFDPPVGGPATTGLGQVAEFTATQPFVVSSQDASHPFLLVTYMTGSTTVQEGYGDADFVRITAADQYLSRYVFFTDPTYPETNLVVIRRKGKQGFADVSLDCAGGPIAGWQPIGASGEFEMTRVDLVRHDFEPQGGCNNGRHEMASTEPFGLWVWGWGTPETTGGTCDPSNGIFTCNVSYGYPAGENVTPINSVVVPPVPK
jgi:hypothetical protein